MKVVSSRVVDKIWGRMSKMSSPASTKLMEQMSREQPMVLSYLGGVDDDILNKGERGILVYLGMFFWHAMKQAGGALPQISEDTMRAAEAATVEQFETLASDPDVEPESGGIDAVFQACGQPELMDFALATLMEAAGYDEEDELTEDAADGETSDDQADAADGVDGEEDEEDDEDEEDEDMVRAENVPLIMLDLKTVVDVLNV